MPLFGFKDIKFQPVYVDDIAKAIEEAQSARKLAKEQEELEEAKALHKSEDATTSDEKQKEIVEKSVKNKIEINPDIKENSIVGQIYAMYNNKYLSEKQYTLTNADKKGNTPAWQNRNKKNVKTGEPLYKKADHMKKEGYQRDPDRQEKDRKTSKQSDPSKDGFTGISDDIGEIMRQNAAMKKAAAAKKVKKEELDPSVQSALDSLNQYSSKKD